MPCRSPWFPPVRLLPPRAPALTVRVRGPCYLPAAGQGACCSRGAVPPPAGQCTAGRGLLLLVHLPSKGGRGGGRCLRKAVRCTAGGALSLSPKGSAVHCWWCTVGGVECCARGSGRCTVRPTVCGAAQQRAPSLHPPCTLPNPAARRCSRRASATRRARRRPPGTKRSAATESGMRTSPGEEGMEAMQDKGPAPSLSVALQRAPLLALAQS